MRAVVLVLAPSVAGLLAFVGARLASPAVGSGSAVVAPGAVPPPSGARRRPPPCPEPEVAEPAAPPAPGGPPALRVPPGWDAAAAERELWDREAARLEASGGYLTGVDCTRYPCMAVVAFGPEASRDLSARVGALQDRWPDGDFARNSTELDGSPVVWFDVALYTEPPHPDLSREVALRGLTLDLDATAEALAWLQEQVAEGGAPP